METQAPSDEELRKELDTLSHLLYDCLERGGDIGPTIVEYDRLRNKQWARAYTLLNIFGLERSKEGWGWLLNCYGLLTPTLHDVHKASRHRRNQPSPFTPLREDDSYPELQGYWTEHVTITDLGNGTAIKTTTRVFHIR